MRVLLFGPGGQVGTEIRRRAANLAEIVPVGRGACDLAAPESARAAILDSGCDIVINASAYTAVDKAETEPALARAVNAEAPRVMAQACALRAIPLVHFSTDYVFDGEGVRPYIETDRTNPLGVYGASKREGEAAIEASGATYAILRLSWVFSAHGGNFVKTMRRLGRESGAVRVVDDQRGRPTAAADATDAALLIARALKGDRGKGGVYHFAGAETATWADFAAQVFAASRMTVDLTRIPTSAFPTPARRPKYSVLDTTKFTKTFGMSAPSWKAGLADVIRELDEKERDAA
ncbi:MAG: dTDP-4-dehydrorhamnose reductase [Parvularculaceae bacterium]